MRLLRRAWLRPGGWLVFAALATWAHLRWALPGGVGLGVAFDGGPLDDASALARARWLDAARIGLAGAAVAAAAWTARRAPGGSGGDSGAAGVEREARSARGVRAEEELSGDALLGGAGLAALTLVLAALSVGQPPTLLIWGAPAAAVAAELLLRGRGRWRIAAALALALMLVAGIAAEPSAFERAAALRRVTAGAPLSLSTAELWPALAALGLGLALLVARRAGSLAGPGRARLWTAVRGLWHAAAVVALGLLPGLGPAVLRCSGAERGPLGLVGAAACGWGLLQAGHAGAARFLGPDALPSGALAIGLSLGVGLAVLGGSVALGRLGDGQARAGGPETASGSRQGGRADEPGVSSGDPRR